MAYTYWDECPDCVDWEGFPIRLEDGTCPICGYEKSPEMYEDGAI